MDDSWYWKKGGSHLEYLYRKTVFHKTNQDGNAFKYEIMRESELF
jgi:hypothetical protein